MKYEILPAMKMMSCAELNAALFTHEPTHEDALPNHAIFAGYYCENSECVVRNVTIDAKWEDGNRPKETPFKCPACKTKMRFLHHIKVRTLVPCE